jgi:hypothetical protein
LGNVINMEAVMGAERPPKLDAYLDHISGVVNFVSQTFSLFEAAKAPCDAVETCPECQVTQG